MLLDHTGLPAAFTIGLDVDGGERVVVVVKGTFTLPRARGDAPRRAEAQVPIADADQFAGAVGRSASTVECDYAPVKPRCDVVLNGAAYAAGAPARRVVAGLQVGTLQKAIVVHGDRRWEAGALGVAAGPAMPFTRLPISYEQAFGGVDDFAQDKRFHRTFLANPLGRGFHANTESWLVDGTPMPNTEAPGEPVRSPDGRYRPMAFGPIGRSWPDRLPFAGTYDQRWLDEVAPLLPADFDTRYHQCVPVDQQIAEPRGGERILLVNLTADGRREFAFPALEMPVTFLRVGGASETMRAMADTVVIEPDQERFCVVWRASLRLRRDIFEIAQIVIGEPSRGRARARAQGKGFEEIDTLVRADRMARA